MNLRKFLLCFSSLLAFLFFVQNTFAQIQPETMKEIQLLLKEKNSRTPVEQKINSRLLQALRESRGQKMIEGVNLVTAKVNADNKGTLKVDISAEITDAFLEKLKNLGGTIIFPSAKYHTVRALVNLSSVETIAGYPEVKFIQPAVLSRLLDAGTSNTVKSQTSKQRIANLRAQLVAFLKSQNMAIGSVTSEGDVTHRAADVRNTYGYAGEGIKIGVLSDSYNSLGTADEDVVNGDLPGPGNPDGDVTPVTVVQDISGSSDEGRAMLQVVHDLAPKAQLFFATANISEAGFASNIEKLRNTYNCNIILDDVAYFDEPPFQDGAIAQAVDQVTASGALYFSSAGNSGSLKDNTSGVFEGDFNDKGSSTFSGDSKAGTIHNFGTLTSPLNGDVITTAGENLSDNGTNINLFILNWSDPLGKSANDYDVFIVNSAGRVKASSTDIQNGNDNPIEEVAIDADSLAANDRLVVFKTANAAVRAFHLTTERGTLSVATDGQTEGHSCAIAAFCMAATPATPAAGGPYPGPFVASDKVESFSSDGPRKIFYNPDGTAITPGNFLFATNGGSTLAKPDLTAADGVATTLPPYSGLSPFYGTSCAAPHAGAIAALLLSANPSLTPTQVRNLLTSTSLDIEGAGYDNNSGFGIIQAFQAMQQLKPTPISMIANDSVSVTESTTFSNHNGFIDPGETGNIVVRLRDSAMANATAVTASITTSTTGVTITGGTATLGTITSSGGSAINTSAPFTFTVNDTIACGSKINFTLTVTYGGGGPTPLSFPISINVGNAKYLFTGISAKLGTPALSSNFTSTTGKQTGRENRAVSQWSLCGITEPSPGINTSAGSALRTYDAYTFINSSGQSQCVDITMNPTANDDLYMLVYNQNGFVPSNPNENFLADPHRITTPQEQQLSVTIASGEKFTVVVHEVTAAAEVGTKYNLNLSLANFACTNFALPLSWLNFNGILQPSQQILLQWKVANEINVSHYEVESSTDGIHFATLESVKTISGFAAAKSYTGYDNFPAKGNNFYRIKEVDNDAHISYSSTITINVKNGNTVIVSPVPATSYVNIQSKDAIRQIQVFSTSGQLLQTITPASNNYELPVSRFSAGNYFLKITTDTEVINRKIIKE